MAEAYADNPETLLREALLDATMTAPGGATPLLPTSIYDVRIGGDEAIVGTDRTIQVPLKKIIIAIRPIAYGTTYGYCGDNYTDADVRIAFTVWANGGADLTNTEERLFFARRARKASFSAHGLMVCYGRDHASVRPYQPITGLVAADYSWAFNYGADETGVASG